MKRTLLIPVICLSILFMSACNSETSAEKEADYDTTKKMVVDILQTEDGKKALVDILSDEKLKQQLVLNSDVVKDSITNVLASEKGKEMWSTLFKDPKFVEGFAKSIADEQKKLVKDLMGDPDFQKQVLDLLNNPEISEQMLGVLKGQKFRSHLQETIRETLETPLFQAKITDILLKAAEKQGKKKEDQSGGEGGAGGGGTGSGGGESS